jgi:anti-anti-sigma factor
MLYISSRVIVLELPERLNHAYARTFLGELRLVLESDRQRIVLDCSQVRYVDSAAIEMLMRGVREAMKGDGDLQLAAVTPPSGLIRDLLRVDGLFEMFETQEGAIQSLHALPTHAIPQNERYPSVYGSSGDLKAAS